MNKPLLGLIVASFAMVWTDPTPALAGHGKRPITPSRNATTVYRPAAGAPFRPMTGTLYDTPYMMVGGSGFTGKNGYAPMGQYGDSALAMYGATASLRATAAPLTLVTRGYDGSLRTDTATGFSYPFLPAASPLVYPTRAQVRGSFDFQSTPPWWDTGQGWVDFR